MAATSPRENGPESALPRSSAPIDVEALIDRWVQRLERFPAQESAARPDPGSPARAAAAPQDAVRLEGESDPIPLSSSGGRIVHRGSIGLRGPCAPPQQLWLELRVEDPLRIAFDHVATWYGAAFDAVNLRRDAPLSWGVWHLSGAPLAHALASFARRAPARSDAVLGASGIGTDGGEDARVTLRTGYGTLLRGDGAERAIAANARLVASLARAAREPAARAAQIEAAFDRSIRPALATTVKTPDGASTTLAEQLRAPRQLAIALHAALAGGLPALRLLAKSLSAGWEPGIDAYVRAIERSGAAALLLGARRILAAAELITG